MIFLNFELNNQPMSAIKSSTRAYPAFSGRGGYANKRATMCSLGLGAIPIGTYFIIDRQSGGLLGPLRDALKDHSKWFSLFAADGKIDDETYCNDIKRGSFRLHPKGALGVSNGCITVESRTHYLQLHAMLKNTVSQVIPGTSILAYGKVIVK